MIIQINLNFQIQQKHNNNHASIMHTRFLILLLLCLTPTFLQQIPLDIPPPTYTTHKNPLTTTTVQDNKILSQYFGNMGYEISGEVYLHDGQLGNQAIFNPDQYTVGPQQYCQLYSTYLQIVDRAEIFYIHETAPLKYLIAHKQKQSSAYILSANSILYRYQFDKIHMKIIEQYPLNSTITGIIGQELTDNIEIVLVEDVLFIVNANESYIVYQGNILDHVGKVQGYDGVDRVVGVGVDGRMLWICSTNSLYIYEVVLDNNSSQTKASFVKKSTYINLTTDIISTITYDPVQKQFYIVSAQKFIILLYDTNRDSDDLPIKTSYEINGNCQKIRKIKNTLYLMCQYERLNFVTQILLTPNHHNQKSDSTTNSLAVLNRYYDESLLEGIRDVESLGLDKILLIGDEQVVLIGQGVNRNTLLKLEKLRKQQYYDVMSSFGLVDVFYLPYYSTAAQATVLLINQNQVKIISILYNPPEIQCVLSREQFGPTASLLVAFNTTHCPKTVETQFEQVIGQGGTLTLCEIFFPMKINIAVKQYERKSAFFIFFLAMMFMSALVLVFVGFGIKIRRKANQMIQVIQTKIKKLQESGKKKKVQKI